VGVKEKYLEYRREVLMLKPFLRWITVLLGIGSLWPAGFGVAQQTQSQQPSTQQGKSKASGKQTSNNPPPKASDADKLSNERMSTRGLKRPPSDKPKTDQQSTNKPDHASTKPDAQK
jgi:cytoskeletal protein RodZ